MTAKGYKFGSETTMTDMRPHFFKLFLDGFNMTEHLRIPPLFKKHILQDVRHSSKALLKGPSGGISRARVVKSGNDIFLKDGWEEFVRENSLGNDEFLLFTYDGNLCFSVQIFDVNGLERVSVPDHRKDQQRPVSPHRAEPSHIQQSREVKGSTKEGYFEGKGKKKPTETNSSKERNADLSPEANYKSSKKVTNRKEKTVQPFTSNHPYFEVCLKLKNRGKYYLHIPNAFSQKYLPVEKAIVVLRNHKEKKIWEVSCIPYGGRGHGFYGGWLDFTRDNNLKDNDACIFELVGPLEMKVHTYQSGSHT